MNESSAQPNPEQIRTAAAAVIADDPAMAALLARYNAGEKLTQAEYGQLGARASLLSRAKRFFGVGGKPTQSNPSAPGDAPGVAPVAAPQAEGNGLPDAELDAGICQRTTRVLLARFEKLAQRKLSNAAREADPEATSETLARFDRAGALSNDDKALLIDLSPDVARELGLNPRKYPVVIFFSVLGFYSAEWWLAIDELKNERKKREDRERQAAAPKPTMADAA